MRSALLLLAWCSLAPWVLGAAGCSHDVGGPVGGEGELPAGEGEGEGEGGCSTTPVDGLVVRVLDTATQFRLCDAQVRIHDGGYTETLALIGDGPNGAQDCQYQGAADRPGSYAIDVTAPNHSSVTVTDEEVTPGACGHPVQTILTVPINPA